MNNYLITIPPHGGYRDLESYQMAGIVHDITAVFCECFIDKRSRMHDQMVQTERSDKQNIAAGSMASGTSKKTDLKPISVAQVSLEELLSDFLYFLRRHKWPQRYIGHAKTQDTHSLAYRSDTTYWTYKTYVGGAKQ